MSTSTANANAKKQANAAIAAVANVATVTRTTLRTQDASVTSSQVRDLLAKLSSEVEANAKKKIRRALRLRGYYRSDPSTHAIASANAKHVKSPAKK